MGEMLERTGRFKPDVITRQISKLIRLVWDGTASSD